MTLIILGLNLQMFQLMDIILHWPSPSRIASKYDPDNCLFNLQMFRLMDMDNNKVLSWAEIMTFNITSLLVNYGDMLPFDPADVHNEDAFLESDVLDEMTNGLTDGPTEETKSSPQNKVSETATPHDEF